MGKTVKYNTETYQFAINVKDSKENCYRIAYIGMVKHNNHTNFPIDVNLGGLGQKCLTFGNVEEAKAFVKSYKGNFFEDVITGIYKSAPSWEFLRLVKIVTKTEVSDV